MKSDQQSPLQTKFMDDVSSDVLCSSTPSLVNSDENKRIAFDWSPRVRPIKSCQVLSVNQLIGVRPSKSRQVLKADKLLRRSLDTMNERVDLIPKDHDNYNRVHIVSSKQQHQKSSKKGRSFEEVSAQLFQKRAAEKIDLVIEEPKNNVKLLFTKSPERSVDAYHNLPTFETEQVVLDEPVNEKHVKLCPEQHQLSVEAYRNLFKQKPPLKTFNKDIVDGSEGASENCIPHLGYQDFIYSKETTIVENDEKGGLHRIYQSTVPSVRTKYKIETNEDNSYVVLDPVDNNIENNYIVPNVNTNIQPDQSLLHQYPNDDSNKHRGTPGDGVKVLKARTHCSRPLNRTAAVEITLNENVSETAPLIVNAKKDSEKNAEFSNGVISSEVNSETSTDEGINALLQVKRPGPGRRRSTTVKEGLCLVCSEYVEKCNMSFCMYLKNVCVSLCISAYIC